jgi:tRNA wybutosine-synthesizing protein 2
MKRPKRPKPPKQDHPVVAAATEFLSALSADELLPPEAHDEAADVDVDTRRRVLTDSTPKRWVVYEPMVLLPSGSFASRPWEHLLGHLTASQRDELWSGVLSRISKTYGRPLTHLAVNDGIPLHVGQDDLAAGVCKENILRSPSGLKMLYGDFGRNETVSSEEDESSANSKFEKAFWVSTKQNGIHQIWAPRWTMFSRGNVKEKARLLSFHDPKPLDPISQGDTGKDVGPLSHRERTRTDLQNSWAVDLYAGIGYFVFSYAKLGLRVLCWELNPWSVEGLRRGAEANRWSVRVVSRHDLERPTLELVAGGEQIIVFLEDNAMAATRIDELRRSDPQLDPRISHVNCGFLPSSMSTWRSAWLIQGPRGDGWLHLHENVGAQDIETRRQEIQHIFETFRHEVADSRSALVEHVELVKTFAPDVWHCVFDVYITKSSENSVVT